MRALSSAAGTRPRCHPGRAVRHRVSCAASPPPPLSEAALKAKTFSVRPDKLLDTATAAAGFLFRGVSGAVVGGYGARWPRAQVCLRLARCCPPLTAVPPGVALVDDDGSPGYTVARLGGKRTQESSSAAGWKRPALPLELYEFQACPFCKRLREGVNYYDLDVVVYPCPRDGPTWRKKAVALGGKAQFPLLRDPNTGALMYESADILQYLATNYGDGVVPSGLASGLAPLLCGLALLTRAGKGGKYRRSKVTEATQPVTLWGYEASPFSVLVREALTELEVPHLLRTCARGSAKRQLMLDAQGLFQAPLLEDANTGTVMFESADILQYLDATYAA